MRFFRLNEDGEDGSIWNRDFERLSRRLHQLQFDAKGMSAGSLPLLHKELRVTINEVTGLEQQVSNDVLALNEGVSRVTRRELLRRTDKLKGLMEDLQAVEQNILQGRVKENIAPDKSPRPDIPDREPDNMREEISAVINMQQDAMNTQDEKLVHLERDVLTLKNITHDVSAELSLHNALLEDAVPEVERVHQHIEETHRTLHQTIKKHSTCMMIWIILGEVLAIILVSYLL